MITITLLNEKGGVGKTTLASTLAAGLAIQGQRVVLVDADPQANLTESYGLPREPAVYDLLIRDARWNDRLRIIDPEVYERVDMPSTGILAVLPSNHETRSIATSTQNSLNVYRRFRELSNSVDYIIVDTSPTPSLLHGSILLATDYVICPVECEPFAYKGLGNSITHLNQFAQEKADLGLGILRILGIVPMRYRGNIAVHTQHLELLKTKYGALVWPEIEQRVAWSEATMVNRTVWAHSPRSTAAKQAWKMVDQAVKVLTHEKEI